MIETSEIEGAIGVKIKLPNVNLVLISGKKGYIMCGYLNIETAEKLGDTACMVTGVSTIEDVLEAKIKACTSKARQLGIKEGMTGREAINILK